MCVIYTSYGINLRKKISEKSKKKFENFPGFFRYFFSTPKAEPESDRREPKGECIQEFYAEQLQCSLPWTIIIGRKCETAEELQKYRILSDSITSQTMTDQIRAKGCFKQNCKKTTWTKNSFDEKWPRSNRTKLPIGLN